MATPMSTAASSSKPRGLGISRSDMEASRLVFVYVRDAKPRRKVAIPLPDNYTWEEFIEQVKSKLRITGVAQLTLASSGQAVSSLDVLQDIDELSVVEGPAFANGHASTSEIMPSGSEPATPVNRLQAQFNAAAASRRGTPELGSGGKAALDFDDDGKAKDLAEGTTPGGKKKRKPRSWFSLRYLLLGVLLCLLLLMIYRQFRLLQ